MRNTLLFPFYFVLVLLFIADAQTSSTVTIIQLPDFKEAVIGKDVQLIDIRTMQEYAAGYIDDAINIPIANKASFIRQFEKLDKEAPVYIYCYSGVRSHRAGNILTDLGFKKIYDFKGGWKVWSSQ